MIMDAQNLFSDAQTTTTGTDTGLTSSNVIDLISAGLEIGTGKPLYVVAIVDTAFTSAGSDDDLAVNLITDDNAAMSSATYVQELMVIPRVSAAGTKVVGVIAPKSGVALQQYIALQFKSKGDGALTAGAVTAFITETPDAYASYPSGYEVN